MSEKENDTGETKKKNEDGPEGKAPVAASPKTGDDSPKKEERIPRRPTLDPAVQQALAQRNRIDRHRPSFVRTASHRYYRVGRWRSWRRPRGLQSKQRRHYGYRPTVVSIGFRSPRRSRGLTPTGFLPVIVYTTRDIERLDPKREAALIARTVGTRRRLILEETARKRGVHLLNPLVSGSEEARDEK